MKNIIIEDENKRYFCLKFLVNNFNILLKYHYLKLHFHREFKRFGATSLQLNIIIQD